MRESEDVIKDIVSFEPIEGNWFKLDELIEGLFETDHPEKGINALLNVFERFPEEDGDGVLWTIVHGLEHLNGYEQELIDSLLRQPSFMSLVMVRRIENTGQKVIAGKRIAEIYNLLINHPKLPKSVKEYINEFLK